ILIIMENTKEKLATSLAILVPGNYFEDLSSLFEIRLTRLGTKNFVVVAALKGFGAIEFIPESDNVAMDSYTMSAFYDDRFFICLIKNGDKECSERIKVCKGVIDGYGKPVMSSYYTTDIKTLSRKIIQAKILD